MGKIKKLIFRWKKAVIALLPVIEGQYIVTTGTNQAPRQSTDYSVTWNQILTINSTGWSAAAVASTGEIQLLGGNGSGGNTIARSDDFGATWALGTDAVAAANALYTMSISETGDYVIAGSFNGNIIQSADKGITWELKTAAVTGNVVDVYMSGSGQYRLILDNNLATYAAASSNYGATYADITSLPQLVYTGGFISRNSKYHFISYQEASNSKFYRSDDFGATWTIIDTGYIIGSALSISGSDDGQIVYYSSGGGSILKSIDAGLTWSQINPPNSLTKPITELVASRSGQYVVCIRSTNDVIRSNDYGATWIVSTTSSNLGEVGMSS